MKNQSCGWFLYLCAYAF